MKTNNILICVCGLTPQIVTETLYCLSVQKKIKIAELYVLTTRRGRDVILGHDAHSATPKTPLNTEIHNLCKKYKIPFPRFENNDDHIIVAREESIELPDIRTDKHNILFPNKTAEFIRTLSLDPQNTLFCSISGGRKTMSVHIAFALSLFGRDKDKLLHVLTSEEFEFKGFYPKNKKQDKELQLSEIPFVRLRSLLTEEIDQRYFQKSKYDEIVAYTQKQLKIITHPGKLLLKVKTKELQFNKNRIALEPQMFALYYKYVDLKLEDKESLSNVYLISKDFAESVRIFLTERYNRWYDDKQKGWWNIGFGKPDILQKHTKINKKISNLVKDADIADQFRISSKGSRGNTEYYIKANKNKFRIIDER
jgi:CRISPR-associated protein (TIGR02584 family)